MLNNNELTRFEPEQFGFTKYLFFTGKGGVGKTSISSAIAVHLAKQGKKVALVSTDPASNLQDVFEMELSNQLTPLPQLSNLSVANFDPMTAAADYRASVIDPFIGVLPEETIKNMEEQLSGSCTVEVASFNEFTQFLSNKEMENQFDHIVFDTAPTGHTLRMLELPDAWNNYLDTTTHDVSCLGQLSGLTEQKKVYEDAVERLKNKDETMLVLVARPDKHSLHEAFRAGHELSELHIENQVYLVNTWLEEAGGSMSRKMKDKQQAAINEYGKQLGEYPHFYIPMMPQTVSRFEALEQFFDVKEIQKMDNVELNEELPDVKALAQYFIDEKRKYIFTMGKGGTGKTTIARNIAEEMAGHYDKVLLATTDPANQWHGVADSGMDIVYIDTDTALENYKQEVMNGLPEGTTQVQIDYILEDLRSPCTEEIAFFKAFSEMMNDQDHDVVVIDTAPTGHTLLLLDSVESYNSEIERLNNEVPDAVKNLLPKIKDHQLTEMVVVTLAEPTPYLEAARLCEDLKRSGVQQKWWVINNTIAYEEETDPLFYNKIQDEKQWINKINDKHGPHVVINPYQEEA